MPELYEKSYTRHRHFSFGKNWQQFLNTLTDDKIKLAKKSLFDFLGGEQAIKNKTFIDVGCGSGIFSLAAYEAGASHVVSIDVDQNSLSCAAKLQERLNFPANWTISECSALDRNKLLALGHFDIVYSWGVLHHTGNMYQAIDNVSRLVKPQGQFYLAIYNNSRSWTEGTSFFWNKSKKFYNYSPSIVKRVMEYCYTLYLIIGLSIHGINPYHYIHNYSTLRGMNFFTDIRDWLGGHPYEYASAEEIIKHVTKNNFLLRTLKTARHTGCNEFLFIKQV